jgi:uncharacterized protein YndB with AHSA1/START domain
LIAAERAVAAPPERVFDFLADLRNHWRLERRFLELDELGEDGGTIRLKGPLGLSRTVQTRVLEAQRPVRVAGGPISAAAPWGSSPGTSGPRGPARSCVSLPRFRRRRHWDRLFLALGGRTWFEGLFRRALENLDTVV